MKPFSVTYEFCGQEFNTVVDAVSAEDAESRFKSLFQHVRFVRVVS